MDWLVRLSGSPAPNAIALAGLAAMTVVAFAMRKRSAGVGFLMMTLAFGAAVGAKNAAYSVVVSGPHHENNLAGRHDYARVLLFVAIAQIALGLITGMIGGASTRRKGFTCLGAFGVMACGFAAACTLDWRTVYLHQNINSPVHFELHAAWIQVVLLLGLLLTGVMAVVSLARRPRLRH